MSHKKDLTLFESAAIITGFGVGGGVMAVPFLATMSGVFPFLVLLVIAFFLSVILHLMVAEIMMRDSKSKQLIEVFDRYLFNGKGGSVFTWIFFILFMAATITNLSAYIAGGGEIFHDVLGIPLKAGHALTYLLAAGVVFFGLKVVGLSEKFGIMAILLLVLALVIGSFGLPFEVTLMESVDYKAPLALFGMLMFCFTSIFSIPQAVEGLTWNPKLVPISIVMGLSINFVIVLTVTIAAMGVSETITRIAIIGWSQALGNWAFISGSVLVLLAMLTSYWSISLALAVIVKERVNLGTRTSWLVATFPTFIVAVTNINDFLGFMRITGGAVSLLLAILILPTYHSVKKNGDVKNIGWELKLLSKWYSQALVMLGLILMAVGSVVEI